MATATLNSYLVITALGADHGTYVPHLMQTICNCGGNILNTRMTTLGNEYGIMLLVAGSWGAIAKIEATLPSIEQKLSIITTTRRTTPKQTRKKAMMYSVHAVTIDREGILNDLTQFFTSQNINIADIDAHTYLGHNGTLMSSMTLNVHIPAATHLPTLREKFLLYCDSLNLDAGLEPLRD